jgi:hypothetical protein
VLPPLFSGFSGSPCRVVAIEKDFSEMAAEEAAQDRENPR